MDCYIKRRFYMSHKPTLPTPPSPLTAPLLWGWWKWVGGGIGGRSNWWRRRTRGGRRVSIVALWPDAFIVPSGRLTVRHWQYIIYICLRIAQSGNISDDIGMIFTAMRFRCNLSFDRETNGFVLAHQSWYRR